MSEINLSLLCEARGEIELLRDRLAESKKREDQLTEFLMQMNSISKHQTNHVFQSKPGDPMSEWFTGRIPVHPLTCGNDSRHTILFPFWTGTSVILRCPDCDYEQTYLPV